MDSAGKSFKVRSAEDRLRAQGHLIGVYSQKAVACGCGTTIWLTEGGKEVEVTAVYSSEAQARSQERWKDVVVVGKVVRFLRAGRPQLDSYTPDPPT